MYYIFLFYINLIYRMDIIIFFLLTFALFVLVVRHLLSLLSKIFNYLLGTNSCLKSKFLKIYWYAFIPNLGFSQCLSNAYWFCNQPLWWGYLSGHPILKNINYLCSIDLPQPSTYIWHTIHWSIFGFSSPKSSNPLDI